MRIVSSNITGLDLHTTENPWRPDFGLNLDRSELVLRKFRAILNKITPQTFELFAEAVNGLPVDSSFGLIRQILDLIYEKAVEESFYCLLYARICKNLLDRRVEDEDGREVLFHQLLLNRCQTKFDADIYQDLELELRNQEISAHPEEVHQVRSLAELDERKRLARRKALGNIRSIS